MDEEAASSTCRRIDRLVTKSKHYLTTKYLDSLANPLKPPTNHNYSHSRNASHPSCQHLHHHSPLCNLKTGSQPVPEQALSSSSSHNSMGSIHPKALSYLHPQTWQKKSKPSPYSENHLVCFPGFVALRSPSYSRAGDIEVFISIRAFRAKPTLDALNRSQRLIHSMICKMTGLPPLPIKRLPAPSEPHPQNLNLIDDDLTASDDEQRDNILNFEPLLPFNSTPANFDSSFPSVSSDHQPKEFNHIPSSIPHLNTEWITPSAKITYTVPNPITSNPPRLPPRPSFSRTSSASSSISSSQFFVDERLPSDFKTIPASDIEPLNEHFSIQDQDLSSLHFNLKERLHSFFSQNSESSKIRLKLYGICSSKSTDTNFTIKKSLFQSRVEELNLLTPELDPDEFIINNGRPLLTQVITTRAGGVWEDKLVLPWQTIETHLCVNQMQNESKLADNLLQSQFSSHKTPPQSGVIRLRIEAELINDESHHHLLQKSFDSLSVQSLNSDAALRKLSLGKSTSSIELDVIPALAESIHVISDIDDTIKHTHVLGGLKYVFQHVFLAGFEQVAIAGMAEWYQALRELGCWIHYISNSPLELWYCIEGFLAQAGFPRGSVSLKEYARGATSILSGMWESAGSRKRTRVEAIIKQFPNSRFICIGDSGEQDLEMYVSLAQAYPGRIISIYIRDVSSPAILGKEICIDQIISHTPRLSSSSLDGAQPRPASRFSISALSTSRSSSPVGEAMIPTNESRSQRTHKNKSHDISHRPNRSSAEPLMKSLVKKPVIPPKPSHLSSKSCTYPSLADATQPSNIKGDSNNLPSFCVDSSVIGSLSRPSLVNTSPRNSFNFQTDPSSMIEHKNTNSLNLNPCFIEPEDCKTRGLLEALINRVQKAQSDLNQLNMNYSPQNHQQMDHSSQNNYLDFTPTKLIFFRNGQDLSALESIQEVRTFLEK